MTATSYRYTAVDSLGARRRGDIVASTEQEAVRRLSSQGLIPSKLKPARSVAARAGRASAKDIAHFTTQLSVLLSARIPITEALSGIAEQEPDPAMRAVITDIASRVQSGEQIAESLESHRRVFGDVYVETVRAAERSGTMIRILDHLAELLEQTAESRRQLRSALMYPCCVALVLSGAILFLLGFVIPKFATMFESRGVELPTLTVVLMVIGKAIAAYWFVALPILGVAAWVTRHALRLPGPRLAVDLLAHRVPVLRDLLRGVAVGRFARVLGLTLGSGLPMTQCLGMAGRASGRPALQREADEMASRVSNGDSLSNAVKASRYLTPFAKRMLCAGDESGELPRLCSVVARQFERDAGHTAKSLSVLIEPVMILTIASTVLVVALAVFVPMWDMVNLVQ